MARNSVILALLLVAFVGLASAQSSADSPTTTPLAFSPEAAASSPDTIGSIGDDDDDSSVPSDDAVAAPVGTPVDASTFKTIDGTPTSAPASGTSAVKFSTAGLVLVVAGYLF